MIVVKSFLIYSHRKFLTFSFNVRGDVAEKFE